MKIHYENDRLMKDYNDVKFLSKKFSSEVAIKFFEFVEKIELSDNLYDAQKIFAGLNIEKLRNKKEIWSARLNIQYRVEFRCIGKNMYTITDITIVRVHPHKY